MSRLFPHIHEVVDRAGQQQLSFTYNDDGEIGNIFTYSPQLDAVVMVDRESFEDRHPSAFAVILLSAQCALAENREVQDVPEAG